MNTTIISDASVLIVFDKIGRFSLLQKVFGRLLTTEEVAREFGKLLPEWIEIKTVPSAKTLQMQRRLQLDVGESSVFVLAENYPECTILIDENKGRSRAKELGYHRIGSLGILARAKRQGIIQAIRPFVEMIQRTNFRVSDSVIEQVLAEADE